MQAVGVFIAAIAGGLIGSMLCEWACVWWRARFQPEVWPKVLKVPGAQVTISADGLMVYRRDDGSFWAEKLRMADEFYQHAARVEPADPRREVH
jgi:hypothetical protein